MKLASLIEQLPERRAQNMTQLAVAERLGWSQGKTTRFETLLRIGGRVKPAELEAYMQAVGVQVQELTK